MNYYEILGVAKDASVTDIARAFRELAKEYHPDLNKNADAKEKFILIYEAYSILKDDQKRRIYDEIIFENDEPINSTAYSDWKESAKEEGKYYSEGKYEYFYESVLKNLKIAANTTKKILGFFLAMVIIGLLGKYITGPIIRQALDAKLENDMKNYHEKIIEEQNNNVDNPIIISTENSVSNIIVLPLPLPLPLENWKRIYLENMGTIDIPPTMEVQSGIYKEMEQSLKPELMKTMGIITNPNYDIIIQQKGLNDLDEIGFQKYARVMINTDIGEFDNLFFDISDFTLNDIVELNMIFHSSLRESLIRAGLKLINWKGVVLKKINGMSCIHISYTRQLNTNPIVLVDIYKFQNVDRMHNLTLSYRQNEDLFWKDDFKVILDSFRIENIK